MADIEIGTNLTILLVIIIIALMLAFLVTMAASAGILQNMLTGLALLIVVVLFIASW